MCPISFVFITVSFLVSQNNVRTLYLRVFKCLYIYLNYLLSNETEVLSIIYCWVDFTQKLSGGIKLYTCIGSQQTRYGLVVVCLQANLFTLYCLLTYVFWFFF
jgi:hypothetical protein